MARTTFTIPDEMLETLGEINKQTGVPVSKLIRDGIVLILAQHGYSLADKSVWGGTREPKKQAQIEAIAEAE